VHSKIRARSKEETEQVDKYAIRPILSLKQLSFEKAQGQVIYQYGKHSSELERMDYMDFIARVTSHIPDKGQVMIRYYGLYSNAHREKCGKKAMIPPIHQSLKMKPHLNLLEDGRR
jgi:hypothetical protein